uniref:F-box/FBD/LRR-repeat protein At1g13570 n=2 Tax=Nicotiana tabacum TaxID=4097 RepID=A0A1S4ALB6_TOBAC
LLCLRLIQLKRTSVEGNREDRISALPRDVIDGILELLPVEEAARTSILSKEWRYIWATLPYLVLDKNFCLKLTKKSAFNLIDTIDKILLQHTGDIVKFILDVSMTFLSPYPDIDRWMLYVTRNGVKELTLNMSNNTSYKLPFYIFNCPTLTRLKLFNCVFKPPTSFLGFPNLITLYLSKVTFVLASEFFVIKAPLFTNLTLKYCDGIQHLKIVSSQLLSLIVCESHYLELNCFTNCKKLKRLGLVGKVVDSVKYVERSTLEQLLLRLPSLEVLQLDSYFLELLSANTVPKGLPFTLDCVRKLTLSVDFGKLGQTSCALQLIDCSPNLSNLEIRIRKAITTSNNADAVLKYVDTPVCLDRPLNKLKHAVICSFMGSKEELLFIKLLFARTPSLVRMNIKQNRAFDSTEERNITTELMRFPRASPKAELFYFPCVS